MKETNHVVNRTELRNKLIRAGLKATQQRIIIFETLLQSPGNHPNAEEVYQKLTEQNPGISLGTIYKTLDSFVEVNLIKKAFSEEGSKRYETSCQVHGHIYCSRTKEMIDYTDPELQKLMADFFAAKQFENFKLQNFSVRITGEKLDPEQSISIS